MDLKQLEYIIHISEESNITKAAKKLYITQSALNQQLLKLEKDLGIELFHRSKNNLYLTEAGKIYIQNAKDILQIKKDTYRKIQDLKEKKQGHLSIGFTPGRGISMFRAVYPNFHHLYPYIMVEPIELSVKEQQTFIREGNLDIGFMTLCEQHKTKDNYITLCQEEIFLAVPAVYAEPIRSAESAELTGAGAASSSESALSTASFCHTKSDDSVSAPYRIRSITDFASIPFVLMHKNSTSRNFADSIFEKAGFEPNILFETSSTNTILTMVASQLCCGLIPEYYIHSGKDIEFYSLPERPEWEISACYRKNSYLSEPAKEFIRLAGAYFRDAIGHP